VWVTGPAWEHEREVRDALRTIIADPQLGVGALSSAQTMSNLLKDLLPDAPRETTVLVAAAEAGLAQILLDHAGQGMDAATACSLTAAAFAARAPFTPEACTWAVAELAGALGITPGWAPPEAAGQAAPRPPAGAPTPRSTAETLQVPAAAPGYRPAAAGQPAGTGYGYGPPAGAGPGQAPPGHPQPGYQAPGYQAPGYPSPGYPPATGFLPRQPGTTPAASRRAVPRAWGIVTAAVMALAVIGGIIAVATGTGDLAPAAVEPLSQLIKPDVTTCKATSALGMSGVAHAQSCQTRAAHIGLLAYQFTTAGGYLAGLAHLNRATGFDGRAAGHTCPPPSGSASGQSRWHSNDNAGFRSRPGQVLECYAYSHDTRVLIYLWTLPTQRVILLANNDAAGADYASLGTWWAGLNYG
jgi:hypothetical protein